MAAITSLSMEYIVLSIPLFFLLMAVELGWSAWTGRTVYRFNDFVANLCCGIGSQVVGAFTKSILFAGYLAAYDHLRLVTIPTSPVTWVIAFLLVDLMYYWFHRLSHEINFMWAAHIVHHQSEEYNLSVALRQSWWQGFFSCWFYLPLAMLGIHPLVIVTVAAFNTLYQFWIHTKAIGTLGLIEALFNTPSHHRVHHGSDPKYLDRNHAGTLIIWDRLFGTFQREEEEPTYGITTPLNGWDPVRANFHYWGDLFTMARSTQRWWDKVLVFLKPPGWRPKDLGGPVVPHAWDHDHCRKFNTQVTVAMGTYVAVQFALLLAFTSFFLFRQTDMCRSAQWTCAGLLVIWVMDIGLLLEGGRMPIALEALRIALLGAWIYVVLGTTILPLTVLILLVSLSFTMLVWAARSAYSIARPA